MPLAAYGGKAEIMDLLAPVGGVYQAGTLSGNPVAVAAGTAALSLLRTKDYVALNEMTIQCCQVFEDIFKRARVPASINRAGSMFTIFFTASHVKDFATAKTSDTQKYSRLFNAMLSQKVYMPPAQFEANFFSFAHSDEDFKRTVQALSKSVSKL
jgi:glutamate-1-semialdehyde 2,1-aminomutase